MQFECINFEGSNNQGACAIDDIRLLYLAIINSKYQLQ